MNVTFKRMSKRTLQNSFWEHLLGINSILFCNRDASLLCPWPQLPCQIWWGWGKAVEETTNVLTNNTDLGRLSTCLWCLTSVSFSNTCQPRASQCFTSIGNQSPTNPQCPWAPWHLTYGWTNWARDMAFAQVTQNYEWCPEVPCSD